MNDQQIACALAKEYKQWKWLQCVGTDGKKLYAYCIHGHVKRARAILPSTFMGMQVVFVTVTPFKPARQIRQG